MKNTDAESGDRRKAGSVWLSALMPPHNDREVLVRSHYTMHWGEVRTRYVVAVYDHEQKMFRTHHGEYCSDVSGWIELEA